MRVALIANPVSRRFSRSKIDRAVKALSSRGCDLEVTFTSKKGDAEDLARDLSKIGYPLIIAAGGDGTFNEVMNGIVLTGTRMGIIPMGTTNVLAKELGIEEDVDGAIMRILNGKEHILSLGLITLTSQSPPISRYFSLMAGIGFDGEAVYGCNETLKRFLGKGAYIISGLKTLLRFSPEPLTLSFDHESKKGYSAIVGKSSKYGGNFRVTPDASLFNKELYLCLMHRKGKIDILRYLFSILFSIHTTLKDITYESVAEITIEGRAKVQIDGDYIGYTPASIRVAPDALRMVF